MNIDRIRQLCLAFPGATEQITWGNDLTFRIAGRIFAVTVLEPAQVWLSFKCSPENFAELTERVGIIPAPYLARAQWVALQDKDALREPELSALLRESYELVLAKLPKKARQAISRTTGKKRKPRKTSISKARRTK